MAKIVKKFTVDIALSEKYGSNANKVIGYARIEGIGYQNNAYLQDWQNQECVAEDIFSFDIEKVTIKVGTECQDSTLAYRLSRDCRGDLADMIHPPVLAHMEYIFSTEYNQEQTIDIDYTDLTQDERTYHVVMTSERKSDLVLTSPSKTAA
jgi:hypothetical protein